MISRARFVKVAAAALVAGMTAVGCGTNGTSGSGNTTGSGGTAHSAKAKPRSGGSKYKLFVNMSYSGNAWQSEASNLAMAIARTPPYNQMATVQRDISGTTVQGQIGTIQSEVAAGADAIVIYPISPTGLDSAITQACQQGVVVVAYDSTVDAPCAYNVSYLTGTPRQGQPDAPSTPFMGYDMALWLANELHGKGNVFDVEGVPGTSVAVTHLDTSLAGFKKFPGIHVIDTYVGMWSPSVQLSATTSALAAHPNVQGIWAGYGEMGAVQALAARNMKVPVAGETENAWRLDILHGYPGVSAGSPPAQGGIAMKVAMQILLHGSKGVPKNIQMPFNWVTPKDVKVCTGNTYTTGCNVFPSGKVSPDATADIFQPELLPESSLSASETGQPTPGMQIHPLPDLMTPTYDESPEWRYVTRGTCDAGWTVGITSIGVKGCVRG